MPGVAMSHRRRGCSDVFLGKEDKRRLGIEIGE